MTVEAILTRSVYGIAYNNFKLQLLNIARLHNTKSLIAGAKPAMQFQKKQKKSTLEMFCR